MINYIICVDDIKKLYFYKEIIQKIMRRNNLVYDVHHILNLYKKNEQLICNNICGKKIFIFDYDNSNIDMLNYAKDIRNLGDDSSQIIVVLDKNLNNSINLIEARKLYLLDIIFYDDSFNKNFNMYLEIDISILNRDKALCFKYNNELFHILYNDIYYIEKNLYNNDSTIITKDNKYRINLSINKLMEILGRDYRFFKSHRSCIVNLDNVVSFDISNSIIKFKNMAIDLVSRTNKKILKEKLTERYKVFNS